MATSPPRRPRRRAAFSPFLLALTLVAALGLAGGLSHPAHAPGRSIRLVADSAPLSASQAQSQAISTGDPVVASAMTTPTSTTTADPDGSFSYTESVEPTQAFTGGAWQSLDPTLQVNAGGTISPAVTTAGLTLSDGGTGPLAVMSNQGSTLSLSWPGALPVPTLSGDTATYTNVFSGVNLVVTVDPQGGFSDTLVIDSLVAAENPALDSLSLTASGGLSLSSDSSGDVFAAASASAPPVFTAQAPTIWDSATPAVGVLIGPDQGGNDVDANSGLASDSSVSGPGEAANTAAVPDTVSGDTVTLTPPAADLSGALLTFPVYLSSVTWHPAGARAGAWTQVDSGYPDSAAGWKEKSWLQVGDCDWGGCDGIGTVRSFFRMSIPSQLESNTVVHSADMYTTETWSASACDDPTPVDLWTTSGGISSSTDWNNQPGTKTDVQENSSSWGHTGCGYKSPDVTWDSSELTSILQGDVNASSQTFELKSPTETDADEWKQFLSGSANITMTVNYSDKPNQPSDLSTSPGDGCGSSKSPSAIGNDDVTFYSKASDNDGSNGLVTTFVIQNSAGTKTEYDTATAGTSPTVGNKALASLTLTRADIEAFNGTTAQNTYRWYTQVTNPYKLTGPVSETCYFSWNPLGPAAPGVSPLSVTGDLGQAISATFTEPSGCSTTTNPCPVSYVYQLGASAPVPETATSGDWTGDITINQVGPVILRVYGVASGGNFGEVQTVKWTGTAPATPDPDGYFTGGSYPDLLAVGTGKKPSLWLSVGSGAGTLSPAVDIGHLGTGINPGTDGPGDWSGAIVAHGDFTGDGVQDVMAYYPATGSGVIIGGYGTTAPLVPESGNVSTATSSLMADNEGDYPSVLVGAGNASEVSTGTDDLIGIAGDSSSGYRLNLYTNGLCTGCAAGGIYQWNTTLSTVAPDNSADWSNYALATAQPGDTAHPAGDPANVVLFALDKATGALYEATNTSMSAASVVGSGAPSSWTEITTTWGSSPPTLVSGDINHAGSIELWTLSGGAATAYTLSGTTLSKEATGSPAGYPSNDWPLTDGSAYNQGPTATTAIDTITGNTATLDGGASWSGDEFFDTDIAFDGSSAYLSPPASAIPDTVTTPSISLWFKTTTAGGVLAAVQNQALSAGGTISGGYDPVLYIGTDGILKGEWWPLGGGPISSLAPVDDGVWHHVVLTVSGGDEYLYLDGKLQNSGGTAGTPSLTFANPTNLTIGAGYIGGTWPDEADHEKDGNTGYLNYFKGYIAAVTFTQ